MKLFFDFEFSGLRKDTDPISLGIVASNGKMFYAEFTDYDIRHIDNWIIENVLDNLLLGDKKGPFKEQVGDTLYCKGYTEQISGWLKEWLKQFKRVEFWADVMPYDGVLLNHLIGVLNELPSNIDYIYYDIATVFKMFGIDPDISREAFIDKPIEGDKHNSLYDAQVIEACYDKLYRNQQRYKVNF